MLVGVCLAIGVGKAFMTTNSSVEIAASAGELPRMSRWCRGFLRRTSLTRTTALIFIVGVLYFCSLQLYQVPISSAKTMDRKVVSPVAMSSSSMPHERTVTEVNNRVPANKTKPSIKEDMAQGPNRVIGNGRSPKQVDEDSQNRHSEVKNAKHLNQTQKSISAMNQTQRSISVPEAYIAPLPSLPGPSSLELLQSILFRVNKEQAVYNQAKFPPLGPDGLVLIVQVHKREGYLKQLLESLKVAKGIENVLLVISHDYYYDDMNKLISSIDFCRVS